MVGAARELAQLECRAHACFCTFLFTPTCTISLAILGDPLAILMIDRRKHSPLRYIRYDTTLLNCSSVVSAHVTVK